MTADPRLIEAIRSGLRERAEPDRAAGMQAYMKSTMPYLGVRVPRVRETVRTVARETPPRTTVDLRDTTHRLWHEAVHREERYAAAALLDVPAARPLRTPALLDLLRELIVDGAWWDHVDELSHRVGDLLRAFPSDVRPAVRGWSGADDRWLRRASIICQLGARDRTDVELLTAAIETNAAERDFFLRKAIGWALRDYARTDPAWVRTFVAGHDLQPLSVREACRHLDP